MKNFWKKFRRKGQQTENDKTERVTGLGRRTREEIAKWNQMTALRFQTGGRHQTSPASLRGERHRERKLYRESNVTCRWAAISCIRITENNGPSDDCSRVKWHCPLLRKMQGSTVRQ